MTFHTRSMTELGRLFIELTDQLSRGGVSAALETIRAPFDADAALLSIECRNRTKPAQCELVLSADTELTPGAFNGTPSVTRLPGYETTAVSFQDPQGANRYVLRLYRQEITPPFDQDEIVLAELLLSQFGRSFEANARHASLHVERTLYSDLLDRLQIGVIVLDRAGRLLTVSDQARAILARRDGLQLVNGRLCTLNAVEDKRFQAIIRDALSGQDACAAGRGLSLTKPSSMRKMGIILRAIPGAGHEGQPALSIYIRDAESSPDVEAELMRQIFDLTPAEAAVARRLTDGLSLEDTAAALDISRNTARAHLRSIFSKSGIKRQTELVRLVLNSAVVL
ncbi:helix-turn-helix transcriptional regulator [Paracoccus sp. 22332]|uniref:helix-turn-helix transcriptional regulator n=1 Tax=Paracoccus sp. 22332 TaxID=3453913 RepID=UPI003F85AFE5